LLLSISGDVFSIHAFIGADVNGQAMKATECSSLSANPRAVGLQSARRQRLFVWVAFLSAVLTSGCQTFNMTPEKFSEQQKGRYDCSPESRTVEVAGFLLYLLHPCWESRIPDPMPEL
jgi:hypothetical protein